MKNTKSFLLLTIAVIACVIFFANMVYSFIQYKQESTKQVYALLRTQIEKESSVLFHQISDVGDKAQELARLLSNWNEMNEKFIGEYIRTQIKEEKMLFGMGVWFEPYAAEKDKIFYGPYYYKDSNAEVQKTYEYSNSEYNYFSHDWYSKAIMSENRLRYNQPYYDETLKTTFLTCSSPVIKDGKKIGVVTADITFREIREYVGAVKVGKTGRAFIVTSGGLRWGRETESRQELEYQITDDEDEEVKSVGAEIIHSKQVGLKKLSSRKEIYAWGPIGDTGLTLVTVYPEEECSEQLNTMAYKNFIVFAVAMTGFILIINATLAAKIEKPMKEVIHQAGMGTLKSDESMANTNKVSFDVMISLIKKLFHQRNRHIEELDLKNKEIKQQKDEISALYQQAAAMNNELNRLFYKLEKNHIIMVKSLSNAIEAKDTYTKGHCEKVTDYAVSTARLMCLGEEDIRCLEYAAILHDIGKIGIPTQILNKPGTLTEEEFHTIQEHPRMGYSILKDVEFLTRSAKIILQHHERPDGKGYPQGLKDEEIDILAKIVSVADAFDAMTRARPYRTNAFSAEEALLILENNKGTQFNKEVVEYFAKMLEKEYLI